MLPSPVVSSALMRPSPFVSKPIAFALPSPVVSTGMPRVGACSCFSIDGRAATVNVEFGP